MRTIIHDLAPETIAVLAVPDATTRLFSADGRYAPCQGCFQCWLKNPGFCVMKDRLQHAGALVGESDPLILISRLCYGSYSSPVKTVLDRAIGVSLPLFTIRGGQSHHPLRYPARELLQVFFYGDATSQEQDVARELVERNRINLGFRRAEVRFFPTPEEIKGAWA